MNQEGLISKVKEKGLTLELALEEDQVERLKFEREAHLEVLRLRTRKQEQRKDHNTGTPHNGFEDESESISLEEEEAAAMVAQFTNGTVLPKGKLHPSLLKLTTLKPKVSQKQRTGYSGKLTSNLRKDTVHVAPAKVAVDHVEESWEDLFESEFQPPQLSKEHEKHEVLDDEAQDEGLEEDEMEMPILILNADLYDDQKLLSQDKIRAEIYEQLYSAREGLSDMLETLFESHALFHSTTHRQGADLSRLESFYPGTRFVCVEYPTFLYDEKTMELVKTAWLWDEICLKTEYTTGSPPSAVRLKHWIRDCSRSLFWKNSMLDEIDTLVEKEDIAKLERQEVLERLDALEQLKGDIEVIMCDADPEQDEELLIGCQERLSDVEQSLLEAREEFDRLRVEQESFQGSTEPRILDMILAMVLQRCDLVLAPTNAQSEEEYYQYIAREHRDLVEGWTHDFGRVV